MLLLILFIHSYKKWLIKLAPWFLHDRAQSNLALLSWLTPEIWPIKTPRYSGAQGVMTGSWPHSTWPPSSIKMMSIGWQGIYFHHPADRLGLQNHKQIHILKLLCWPIYWQYFVYYYTFSGKLKTPGNILICPCAHQKHWHCHLTQE